MQSQEALRLAQELAHPFSLVFAQDWLAWVHQFRQEAQAAHDQATGGMALAAQQGFALYAAWGTVPQGWAHCKPAIEGPPFLGGAVYYKS